MMKLTDPYSQRNQAQRAATDADQAEFSALRNGSVVIDSGVYDDRIAGVFDDFDINEPSMTERKRASWHSEDLKYDTAVGKIYEEIERRVAILECAYPFKLDKGTLSYKQINSKIPYIYEFFLSICNSGTLTTGAHARLPRVFERITAKLVASYMGEYARHIHTGWPRDPEIGISFKEAMRSVSERTGEFWWEPEEGLPNDPDRKDEGCDFVVWPDAPDGRKIGQLFVLGQCACGDNWQDKYNDLDIKKFQKWFHPLSLIEPVRSFATPHHVTDALLREASREGGLFFDRARLTMIAFRAKEDILDEKMTNCINKLVKLVLG